MTDNFHNKGSKENKTEYSVIESDGGGRRGWGNIRRRNKEADTRMMETNQPGEDEDTCIWAEPTSEGISDKVNERKHGKS